MSEFGEQILLVDSGNSGKTNHDPFQLSRFLPAVGSDWNVLCSSRPCEWGRAGVSLLQICGSFSPALERWIEEATAKIKYAISQIFVLVSPKTGFVNESVRRLWNPMDAIFVLVIMISLIKNNHILTGYDFTINLIFWLSLYEIIYYILCICHNNLWTWTELTMQDKLGYL